MSWTFADSATPSTKDQVRILIGDVDAANPIVSDETIGLYVSGGSLAQSNVYASAVAVGRAILARYAHTSVDVSAGGTSVSLAQRIEHIKTMLAVWQQMALIQGGGASAYLGGSSIAAKAAYESDTDRVPPSFTRRDGDLDNGDPLRGDR